MILDVLADGARARVARAKERISLDEMRRLAEALPPRKGLPFKEALQGPNLSFICELKRASPSKGLIAEDFPYMGIAKAYEAAGADALSVLTEPERFLGDDRYLSEIAASIPLPALRKDFIVDLYQVYEAKTLGAAALLLICAILPRDLLLALYGEARRLSLDVLVETHDEKELGAALELGAEIIGVNNRDLKSFEVDLSVSERLGALIPNDKIFVAESGISTPADARRLRAAGADALLIGEALMRAPDQAAFLREMRAAQ
ncbi:MAG: indole-3-glycerol phosphate synthase TrpC [Christensenellaceae bacterium]|jgi:indole-3-glycerol phosphate synthase|nr:indole-3-glycerol phosphate synthase TrpC [Christensenellaceae bacterium]